MLYDVNASLQYKFLYLCDKEIISLSLSLCSSSVDKDWDFLKQLLNCTRMEKVQAAFPTMVLGEKGRRKES